ncbi:hypothetical protein [Streptacidiphilus pinicola]|uniref:hypothetical protein n=1 Tax=Streptacidiphilus pinicola TaxID=2219663 RepID=UPI001A9F4C07|nr:hypothetical protein [Streptacidiphilus pinicola]
MQKLSERTAAETEPVPASQDDAQYRPGRTISDWKPEGEAFWLTRGRKVAARNLWISVPALLLGFVVWQVWSVTVVNLQAVGFPYSASQLFWLTAVPGITGGTLRIVYTFAMPLVGGRRWIAFSTLVLVAPLLWLGFAVQDTSTPYSVMLVIAAYGFFFIPAMFANFSVTSALWTFVGCYGTCLAVCWWRYARRGAVDPS